MSQKNVRLQEGNSTCKRTLLLGHLVHSLLSRGSHWHCNLPVASITKYFHITLFSSLRIVSLCSGPVLATCLLHQRLQLLVDNLPQLHLVPVLLVEVNTTEHAFLVSLLELLKKTKSSCRRNTLVFVTLRFSKIRKVGCPVPRDEQVQQLSENN